jgi:hypothetical protein
MLPTLRPVVTGRGGSLIVEMDNILTIQPFWAKIHMSTCLKVRYINPDTLHHCLISNFCFPLKGMYWIESMTKPGLLRRVSLTAILIRRGKLFSEHWYWVIHWSISASRVFVIIL